jgi:hypothetical protein
MTADMGAMVRREGWGRGHDNGSVGRLTVGNLWQSGVFSFAECSPPAETQRIDVIDRAFQYMILRIRDK